MIFTGKLVRVIDGDTYVFVSDVTHMDPERPTWIVQVRCAHFDAPERREAGFEAAKTRLAELLSGSFQITTLGRDNWKRLVAETTLEDHRLLSGVMIEEHHAGPVSLRQQLAREPARVSSLGVGA